MKTIVLGDIHGRNVWKDIVFQEEADRVIFIGDYFDSFDIGPADQMFNFKEIIEFKEKSGDAEKDLIIREKWNTDFNRCNLEGIDIQDKKTVLLYGRSFKKLNYCRFNKES